MLYKKHIKLNKKVFYFVSCLGIFLFLFISSAPNHFKENVRCFCINKILSCRFSNKPITFPFRVSSIEDLKSENYFLKQEINRLRSCLSIYDSLFLELKDKRQKEVSYFNNCLSAQVIFRDPFSWGSSLWINLGKQSCPSSILRRNSPVIVGQFLLGIVDYVGQKQSRVRLITDVGLTPSVCVATEDMQDIILRSSLTIVLEQLKRKEVSLNASQDISLLHSFLSRLDNNVFYKNKKSNLCRGILYGTGSPLWKKHKNLLKGQGFCFQESLQEDNFCLIKENDILVTTGIDGIFPAGLLVAKVTHVFEKKEGFYSYNLEAVPLIDNFDDVSDVLVLPPVEFDKEDFPSIFRFLTMREN